MLDDFGKLAVKKLTENIEEYNSLMEKTKALSSFEEFYNEWKPSTPSAELSAYIVEISDLREQLEAALVNFNKLAEPAARAEYDEILGGTGASPEYMGELLKNIRSTQRYVQSCYGEDALTEVPSVVTKRGTPSNAGGGSGRRIRGFDVYIDGALAAVKNAKGETKSTFSVAAKELGVETTALQRAFFDGAGSDDVNAGEFPTVVEFTFNGKTIRAVKVDEE